VRAAHIGQLRKNLFENRECWAVAQESSARENKSGIECAKAIFIGTDLEVKSLVAWIKTRLNRKKTTPWGKTENLQI